MIGNVNRRGFLKGVLGLAAGAAATKIVGPFSLLEDRPKLWPVPPKPDILLDGKPFNLAPSTLSRVEQHMLRFHQPELRNSLKTIISEFRLVPDADLFEGIPEGSFVVSKGNRLGRVIGSGPGWVTFK